MPIREIYQFIHTRSGAYSREELVAELRKKGYAEDEIQEALLVERFAEPQRLPQKGTPGEGVSAIPTIGEITLQKKGAMGRVVEILPERDLPAVKRIQRKGEFFSGFIAPFFLYAIGLLFIAPPSSYLFPPSVTHQLILMGASIVCSLSFYLFLRNVSSDFVRGIPYGIVALVSTVFAFLLIRYIMALQVFTA